MKRKSNLQFLSVKDGGQPPYPRGLTHYGQVDGETEEDPAYKAQPGLHPLGTIHGARVAPQRCPILRDGIGQNRDTAEKKQGKNKKNNKYIMLF